MRNTEKSLLLQRSWRLSLCSLGLLLCLWPSLADACPVCFDPNEESRMGFLIATALLTFLPLSLIGGTIYWFVYQSRKLASETVIKDEA